MLAGVLLALPACHRNDIITYRIILPNGYVGWVRVDSEVKTPPAIPPHDVLTFRVGEDGTCQTTFLIVYTVPTNYEFFYDTTVGLSPVRDDLVDHSVNAGGFATRSENPKIMTAWYFFVGPKEYRNQHPRSEFTSHASLLPTPGPIPLSKP